MNAPDRTSSPAPAPITVAPPRALAETWATLDPGLSSHQVEQARAEWGFNELPEPPGTPLWLRIARQFKSPLIYVLLLALAFDVWSWFTEGGHGLPVEAIAIGAVLLLNAGLGVFQERRSEQALAQLKALAAPLAWVLRDGELKRVPTRELVPGDVIRIESGERIPADGRVVEGSGVAADESVLTGESLAVDKSVSDDAYSGTLLVRGKGTLKLTATGPRSTMGKLAALLENVRGEATPLEKRLDVLGKQIARWVFGIAALMAVGGIASEGVSHLKDVVLFAAALAVAAVPEGMPAVVTMTLALGVQRMTSKNAVVRRLAAVEALGSVTVIATDKTGTLTENKMSVHALDALDPGGALKAMVLANDADDVSQAGDPLEVGLLTYARSRELDPTALRRSHRRHSLRPFDSEWKFMRVTVDEDAGGRASYLKGAPEVLLPRCRLSESERADWAQRADAAAAEGYRVLALARGEDEREDGLSLLGLVTLWDPPRPEVPPAIATAHSAGIRVVLITGDHPGTARAVARQIGIGADAVLTGAELQALSPEALQQAVRNTQVFARVSPEHKLKLVDALKADGEVVAMTGDGVNDAPALKRSDVGIAMGQRGSDVAREVADIVLLDDNFASIVGAVEEGRGIYGNIQSFIRFTLSTNVGLVLLIAAGAIGSYVEGLRDAAGLLLVPVTALQLLWINFLGDGPPALALALDRHPDVMHVPPRDPKSGLLDRPTVRFIFGSGLFKGLVGIALLVILPVLGMEYVVIRTVIFLSQSIAKLISAYPSRNMFEQPRTNAVLHLCVLGGVLLQLATPVVPALRELLRLKPLSPLAWAATGLAIVLSQLGTEAFKVLASRSR